MLIKILAFILDHILPDLPGDEKPHYTGTFSPDGMDAEIYERITKAPPINENEAAENQRLTALGMPE